MNDLLRIICNRHQDTNHCVGASGGRSSFYLMKLLDKARLSRGINVHNTFMDTGAEHPLTYQFVNDMVRHWGIPLTCLQAVYHEEMGVGVTYKEVEPSTLKWDLSLMADLTSKYGGFTQNRPWCTDKLKTIVVNKFRRDLYGKNFITWIGIRFDEPKRLWGDIPNKPLKSAYAQLVACGMDDVEISTAYQQVRSGAVSIDDLPVSDLAKKLMSTRIDMLSANMVYFLADISTFDKSDVISWWKDQPFDLQIEEWLGNCVFCVKKSINKIAIAQRDEPVLFDEWNTMVTSESVREMPADKFGVGHIYRQWLTPDAVIQMFADVSTEDLKNRTRGVSKDESACSESCHETVGEPEIDFF